MSLRPEEEGLAPVPDPTASPATSLQPPLEPHRHALSTELSSVVPMATAQGLRVESREGEAGQLSATLPCRDRAPDASAGGGWPSAGPGTPRTEKQ